MAEVPNWNPRPTIVPSSEQGALIEARLLTLNKKILQALKRDNKNLYLKGERLNSIIFQVNEQNPVSRQEQSDFI